MYTMFISKQQPSQLFCMHVFLQQLSMSYLSIGVYPELNYRLMLAILSIKYLIKIDI